MSILAKIDLSGRGLSPKGFEMLQRLMAGNERFVSGLRSVESIATVSRLAKLASEGQKPFAMVLGCADSRIPTELLFDQGLGDLFIVRVAGNVVAPSLIASMEFAATTFETPLLVVMGHTKCGAIQAAVDQFYSHKNTLGKNLKDLVERITPAVKRVCEGEAKDHIDLTDVARENVQTSIHSILAESEILKERVETSKLLVVGAMVDIGSGKVSFHLPESIKQESAA